MQSNANASRVEQFRQNATPFNVIGNFFIDFFFPHFTIPKISRLSKCDRNITIFTLDTNSMVEKVDDVLCWKCLYNVSFPIKMLTRITFLLSSIICKQMLCEIIRWKIESINIYHKKITFFFILFKSKIENRRRFHQISIKKCFVLIVCVCVCHSRQTCLTFISVLFLLFRKITAIGFASV